MLGRRRDRVAVIPAEEDGGAAVDGGDVEAGRRVALGGGALAEVGDRDALLLQQPLVRN